MSAEKKFIYKLQAQYEGAGEIKKIKADLKSLNTIRAFEKLQRDIEKTEADLKKAETAAEEFKNASDTKGTNAYRKAEAQVRRLTTSLERQNTKLEKHAESLKKSGINTKNLKDRQAALDTALKQGGTVIAARNRLQIRSTRQIREEIIGLHRAYRDIKNSGTISWREKARAAEALRRKTSQLKREMRGLSTTSKLAERSISGLRSSAASLAVLFSAGSAIFFARSLWEAAVSAQQLDRSFVAIYGDSKKAADEMAFLRAVSDELGLNFQKTAQEYRGMAAASKGTILEGEKTRQIFVAIAEASTVLGLSADQTSGALNAIAQMMSKGKIQAEELRGQLGDRLYGAFQLVAKAAGVSTQELDKMLESGKVSIDILEQFAQVLHGEYGASAKAAADDAQQAYNRMQNSWRDLRVEMANAGFMEEAVNGINGVAAAMRDPQVKQAALEFVHYTISFLGVIARLAVRAKGAFELVASMLLQSAGHVLTVAKGVAWLTDKVHLTSGAFDAMNINAQAAFGASDELARKAGQSFKTAARKVKIIGRESKKTGSVVDKTFAGMATSAKNSGNAQVAATKKATAAMADEYKKYGDKVIAINDKIKNRSQSLAEQLRSMARSGMSDLGAWEDRKKQAEEYMAAARKAAKAGNAKEATAMADKARQAYADLNEEIEQNGQVIISKQEALAVASRGVKAAGELAIKVLEKEKEAAKKAREELDKKAGGQLSGNLQEITEKKPDEFNKNWNRAYQDFLNDGKGAISDLQDSLDILTKDRHMKVYVKEVIQKASGGLVHSALAMSGGGAVALRNMLRGGHFPGFGGGDRRHVIAEDGEYMLDKFSVRAAGIRAVMAMHRQRWDIVLDEMKKKLGLRMQLGGMVGLSLPALPPIPMQTGGPVAAPAGRAPINLTVNFPAGTPASDQISMNRMATLVAREMDRKLRSMS